MKKGSKKAPNKFVSPAVPPSQPLQETDFSEDEVMKTQAREKLAELRKALALTGKYCCSADAAKHCKIILKLDISERSWLTRRLHAPHRITWPTDNLLKVSFRIVKKLSNNIYSLHFFIQVCFAQQQIQ